MDSIKTGLAAAVATSSTLEGTKFKIQQTIPSGSIKRGPHAIVRTADLNNGINIQRRYGEGSKPLFERDDIAVNQTALDAHDSRNLGHERNTSCKTKSNRRSSSTESSSPERYRHRDIKKHSSPTSGRRKTPERHDRRSERPTAHSHDKHNYNIKSDNTMTDKYKSRSRKSKSRSPPSTSSNNKKKPVVEKVPYYRDEQREKDRIRRLYGRSRSRTPPPSSKSSSSVKRNLESPARRRRRSNSRDRLRRHSPPYHRSVRRGDYRSRRSRTRSRTRSPQRRERHKHSSSRSSRERDNVPKEDPNSLTTAMIPTTPQIIPIPVPVPADYAAYTFPGWTAAQPTWPPTHHRPPATSHFAPFPMWPMMPPLRPPPHQAPYGGGLPPQALPYPPMTASYRPHAPQRYPQPRHNSTNYQSRPKKPTS